MTIADTLTALFVALVAMYGLGIPLAWLLPAPESSPWVHRIAVGPIYSILLASLAAWILRMMGIPLHPAQLVALIVGAWVVAWVGTDMRAHVRAALRRATVPFLLMGTSGMLWLSSLVGFGLYLPNRDFKNHAYWVAQVALSRTSDSRWVLRSSPLDSPLNSRSGYPLGLHTLLGWALPSPDWNAAGVTAAAAVLALAISLPLAMLVLAGMWTPEPMVGVFAGFAVVALPGVTSAFQIGAVTVLVGTALYAASLPVLWTCLRHPSWWTLSALLMAGFGLLVLHVAEAVSLGLVLALCAPGLLWRHRSRVGLRTWLALMTLAVGALLLGFLYVRPAVSALGIASAWDVEDNTFGLVSAPLVALMRMVANSPWTGALWIPLILAGFVVARLRRLSPFPLAALLVALALAVLAGSSGVPDWLRPLAAPWYGAIGRVALVGVPPAILAACLALAALASGAGRLSNTPFLHVTGRVVIVAAVTAYLVLPAWALVPERRLSLSASLAGAGDTPQVAAQLVQRLAPGESVLTFEGDGGVQLFATGRVPIVQSPRNPAGALATREDPRAAVAILGLARLAAPDVAAAMAELGVRYVAVGTTSTYWSTGVGYDVQALLTQPELSVALRGSDMVVLEYRPRP